MADTYLKLAWTVSRGRETYGYSIVTLTDTDTGEKYRCMGGGYDMIGTVFGAWLADVHQASLWEIRERAYYVRSVAGLSTDQSGLYGMTWTEDDVRLDGACGLESMAPVAEALGLSVRKLVSAGQVDGFIVGGASVKRPAVVVAGVLVLAGCRAHHGRPVPAPHATIYTTNTPSRVTEDDPRWDCRTMGNRICGPTR